MKGSEAVEQELLAQLEFYFSDASLRRDKHLRQLLGPSKELTGWVSLSEVLSFRKAAAIFDAAAAAAAAAATSAVPVEAAAAAAAGKPDLAEAGARLALAVRALAASSALECSEDGASVRRRHAFVVVAEEALGTRTVYVEPLDTALEHAEVAAVFAACGDVLHVSLPKTDSKKRRAFGFVEFEHESAARAAIARFDGQPLADGGRAVRVVTRLEWAALRKRWNDIVHNPATAARTVRQKAKRPPQPEHDDPTDAGAADAAKQVAS